MAAISKEEYLKRYLSSGPDSSEAKKKKKRRPKAPVAKLPRSCIIDDDIDLKVLKTAENEEVDLYEDEAPTVAGEVDERPEKVKQLEVYRASQHWKKLGHRAEEKARHGSDSEVSQPLRARLDSGSSQSPQRKYRHDSGSDQSPPRRQRHDSGSDQSPPRRQRHDSGSDQSPPRRQRHDSDSDQSPLRRKRQNSESDQSPPRRKRQNSDSDQSPPRRKRQNSDSDQSPPRRKKPLASDHKSTTKSESTNSNSRRRKASRFDAPLNPDPVTQDKMTKTLSGLKAGLSTAQSMRRENEEKRRREDNLFKKADESVLGRNARTVFRSKESGRRRDLVAEAEAEAVEDAKKQAMVAKYQEWGRGLAQQASRSAQAEEALHEAQKPLARSRGDEDLEKMLREQERDGDPMLAFLHKKKSKTGPKAKEKPRYKGSQPPQNRFNLWPGYRWDGVDRSNGFEKSLFAKQAEKKAHKEDAYKWSVEDM